MLHAMPCHVISDSCVCSGCAEAVGTLLPGLDDHDVLGCPCRLLCQDLRQVLNSAPGWGGETRAAGLHRPVQAAFDAIIRFPDLRDSVLITLAGYTSHSLEEEICGTGYAMVPSAFRSQQLPFMWLGGCVHDTTALFIISLSVRM